MPRGDVLINRSCARCPHRVWAGLLAGVVAMACSGDSLERVRLATYPRDFHYITKQQIHTTMGALATEVDALDQIMWEPTGPSLEDQPRVVAILERMRELSRELKSRAHSNHLRIDGYAPALRHDVERALAAAKMEPPNYYYAGVVSGACTYCHSPRHQLREAQPGSGLNPDLQSGTSGRPPD